ARGDANRDTLYWPAQQRMAVTELMDFQTTMDMAWYADRPGGWIFHCHLNFHVVRNPAIGAAMEPDSVRIREVISGISARDSTPMAGMKEHDMAAMGGLMLRMDITPSAAWHPYAGPRERLHLYIRSDSVSGDTLRRFGYALSGAGAPPPDSLRWPGPPIILHVGQPTSIMVVNQTPEASQVHWHGLELNSYYDGVAGISNSGDMVAPMIAPRDSFEMTATPPRAGSFMYHTHINDVRQQSHGLYGALIVLPKGANWDPSTDLIFMVGTDPLDDPILNGSASPPALALVAGKTYRIRLMNLTLDAPYAEFSLTNSKGAVPLWTALAKDGYDRPAWQKTSVHARQRVSIGETYDFALKQLTPGDYAMEMRGLSGKMYARQVIHVAP
ncbi:MAG: multicopper oxidase domain-containing protein, partial [Gemmatimonadales bacterium]